MPENGNGQKSFLQRKNDDNNQKKELCGYTSDIVIDKFEEFGNTISLFVGGGTTTSCFFEIFIKNFSEFAKRRDRINLEIVSSNLSIPNCFIDEYKNKREISKLYLYGEEVDVEQCSLKPLKGCPSLNDLEKLLKSNIAIISCREIWYDSVYEAFCIRAYSEPHASLQKEICNNKDIYTYMIADDSKFTIKEYNRSQLENLYKNEKRLFMIIPKNNHFKLPSNLKNNYKINDLILDTASSNLSIVVKYEGEPDEFNGGAGAIFSHLKRKFSEKGQKHGYHGKDKPMGNISFGDVGNGNIITTIIGKGQVNSFNTTNATELIETINKLLEAVEKLGTKDNSIQKAIIEIEKAKSEAQQGKDSSLISKTIKNVEFYLKESKDIVESTSVIWLLLLEAGKLLGL